MTKNMHGIQDFVKEGFGMWKGRKIIINIAEKSEICKKSCVLLFIMRRCRIIVKNIQQRIKVFQIIKTLDLPLTGVWTSRIIIFSGKTSFSLRKVYEKKSMLMPCANFEKKEIDAITLQKFYTHKWKIYNKE